jgi:hypothetical protein
MIHGLGARWQPEAGEEPDANACRLVQRSPLTSVSKGGYAKRSESGRCLAKTRRLPKVAEKGLEPTAKPSGKTEAFPCDDAESDAVGAQTSGSEAADPLLEEILRTWGSLPASVRQRISGLLRDYAPPGASYECMGDLPLPEGDVFKTNVSTRRRNPTHEVRARQAQKQ